MNDHSIPIEQVWSHGTYLSNGESNDVQQDTDGTTYSSHSKSETYAHCKNSSLFYYPKFKMAEYLLQPLQTHH